MWVRILSAVLMLAAVACGGGEPTFQREDVLEIVLQPEEAPAGTRKIAEAGGEQDLDAFARNATEREALVADGFVSGYVSYFFPDEYFDPGARLELGSVAYQVIAGLFEDPAGASSSLRRFARDLQDRQLQDAETATLADLGDESQRITGSSGDGEEVLVLLWRRANLILVLIGSGPLDEAEMTAAAAVMAERAG